jgi:ribosomal protein S6
MRNSLHELKLIEADLPYKISDKQKTYYMLIILSPDLNKDVINEIKFKIISRDQIITIAQRYKKNFKN